MFSPWRVVECIWNGIEYIISGTRSRWVEMAQEKLSDFSGILLI